MSPARQSKVTSIAEVIGSAIIPIITQKDLAEEKLLEQQLAEARLALREKRQQIRSLLERGAAIEPGLRSAEIRTRRPLIIR